MIILPQYNYEATPCLCHSVYGTLALPGSSRRYATATGMPGSTTNGHAGKLKCLQVLTSSASYLDLDMVLACIVMQCTRKRTTAHICACMPVSLPIALLLLRYACLH